jgi:hypothetical protein
VIDAKVRKEAGVPSDNHECDRSLVATLMVGDAEFACRNDICGFVGTLLEAIEHVVKHQFRASK